MMNIFQLFHDVIPPANISLGFFSLHNYSAFVGFGVLAAMTVICLTIKNTVSKNEQVRWFDYIASAMPIVLLCGILGGRFFFVLYHLDYFSTHISEAPLVWHGGWVWYGALSGGLVALAGY